MSIEVSATTLIIYNKLLFIKFNHVQNLHRRIWCCRADSEVIVRTIKADKIFHSMRVNFFDQTI